MNLLAFALAAAISVPATALHAEQAESAAVRAGADPSYLRDLLGRAHEANLAADPQWLRLGHWRRGLGGLESEADGSAFFLSPRGKTDSAAELDATIAAFFAPPGAEPDRPLGEPQRAEAMHPQCRFPARLSFLAARLGLDPARLPLQRCPRFEQFWSRVQARSVTLIFSSYYLNNPASSFGHTFLRLDKEEGGARDDRHELLDQGVDYAAVTDTSNALLYAVKGLTGLFRGQFTARPYFYKVREYADYESRDLWEYDLALDPPEVAMLVAHLWELGGTWFDYWYLTENCSYHVLGALEAAAPRLQLLSRVGKVVIPADTVKAVAAEPGLVRAVRWRPSIRTQFQARTAGLDAAALDAVEAVARDPAAPLPPGLDDAGRARTLDAAADLVDLRHGKEIALASDTRALALRQALLERRASIPVVSPPLVLEPPAAGGPDRGHGSARISVGAAGSEQDGPLLAVEGRIALHDLADPPPGYSPRARIEFLRVRGAFATRERRLRLDEAWLVEVASLNDLDRFDHRFSWRFRAGAERVRDAGCASCVAGKVEFGGGPAMVTLGSALSALATFDAELAASPPLEGFRGSAFRPGFGPTGVLRLLGGDRAVLLGTAAWRWYPEAAPRDGFMLGAEARVHFRGASLALEVSRAPRGTEAIVWTRFFR
jgi:hypothetical protein